MRKRFSRARLLIEAYRMGVDDMVKELGRASRRMEEKCEKVRGALKRASAAFAKLEESPSGWSTPEAAPGTPTAAALTQQQPGAAALRPAKSRLNIATPSSEADAAPRTAAEGDGGAGPDADGTAAEAPEVAAAAGEDGSGAGAAASAEAGGGADGAGPAGREGTPSTSLGPDHFITAHEDLLESIRDLEEARAVYEELVTVAETLSTQKSKTVLDFCLQKHKKLSKTMEEVEVVESAVDDMFDEYDAFLEFLNH